MSSNSLGSPLSVGEPAVSQTYGVLRCYYGLFPVLRLIGGAGKFFLMLPIEWYLFFRQKYSTYKNDVLNSKCQNNLCSLLFI